MDMINPRGEVQLSGSFLTGGNPPTVRKVAAMAAEAAEASAFCPNDPVASAWQACLAVTPCVGSKQQGFGRDLRRAGKIGMVKPDFFKQE